MNQEKVCNIITVFEEYLQRKGVEIPNKDRDREIELGEDPTELAIIYGEDYYLLEDRLLNL